jgi:hypothetical protein
MKAITFFFVAVLALAYSQNQILTAQTTSTWQGGKPGRTNDWDCPANWKEGRTPNEFSQVVIPSGRLFYPVITTPATPIDALLLEGDAALAIRKGGSLLILCETGRFDGVILLGKIANEGNLEIRNIPPSNLAIIEQIGGKGRVVCNKAGGFSQ